jgi:hypothetical protein
MKSDENIRGCYYLIKDSVETFNGEGEPRAIFSGLLLP